MTKDEILKKALELVTGDRAKTHGNIYDQFQHTADLWTAYLYNTDRSTISACDVAILNMLQKISRSCNGEINSDDYVDMAGYAAIAGELAE